LLKYQDMKYWITTFGCQQNIADSKQIACLLEKQGLRPAADEKMADLVVVNACSVRKSAVDRAYAKIKQSKKAGKKVILAGCFLGGDAKNLESFVDEIWHPHEYFCASRKVPIEHRAFISVMTGCDNFCAYCIVPFTRGREKSRTPEKIIADIEQAVENGAKEIVLLGQNVNSYHSQTIDFPGLLRKIDALSGDFWLTFISNHPKDMTDKLIETAARCQKVSPVIHLPFQSGNNRVLKSMNRHYTVAHYKKLLKKLRLAFAQNRQDDLPLSVTADVIIGFPGETDKEFNDSAELMREMEFDTVFLNIYSPRPGTAAAKLKDDVSFPEKRRREKVLNEILRKTALKKNKAYVGREAAVLVDEIKAGYFYGKTKTQKNVRAKISAGAKIKIGKIYPVKIIKAAPWSLEGKTILNVK